MWVEDPKKMLDTFKNLCMLAKTEKGNIILNQKQFIIKLLKKKLKNKKKKYQNKTSNYTGVYFVKSRQYFEL